MTTRHLLLATTALAAFALSAVPAMADGGEPPPGYRDREPPPPPPLRILMRGLMHFRRPF